MATKDPGKPTAAEKAAAEKAAAAKAPAAKVKTGVQSAGDQADLPGAKSAANPELEQARRPAPVADVDKGETAKSDVAPQDHEKTLNSDHDPDTLERQKAGLHAKAATQTEESAAVDAERERLVNLSPEQIEAERDAQRRDSTDETGVKKKGPITRVGDDNKGLMVREIVTSEPRTVILKTNEQGGFVSCTDKETGEDCEVPIEARHMVN